MAKGKPTPEKSTIERGRPPLAYSRRQKDGDDKPAEGETAEAEAKATEPAKPAEVAEKPTELTAEAREKLEPPVLETPHPPKGEPWPDATPQPMRPVEPATARAKTETITIPAQANLGTPPAMPGTVEDPTQLPGPRDLPGGNVTDAALPPGRVPAGDSRSLRKDNEFALIYRIGTAVITRFGIVGQRGQWRVVEYPTPASASNSYAKEVSRFVGEGFVDYRD